MVFESNVKVGYFSLEDVRHFLRIWDNALYDVLIIRELNLADDGSERIVEQLDDLVRRVFSFFNEDVLALSFLCTADNQRFRYSTADSNGMHSRVFDIFPHQIDNTLSI